MMNSDSYYKVSWKYSIFWLICFIIFWLIGSIFFALVYSLANWFDPLIYFQVVIIFARIWLISWFINKLVYIFKIRNKLIIYIFGVIFVFISLYIHWSIYTALGVNTTGVNNIWSWSHKIWISYISTDFVKIISDILWIIVKPSIIIQNMKYLFDNWSWSIWSSIISGWFLLAIWVLEGLIFGIYTLVSLPNQVNYPFSEVCHKRFDQKVSGKLKMPLDVKSENDLSMIKQELEKWSYFFLKQLKKWWVDLAEYCELRIYILDDDIDHAYVSIDNIYETTNNKWEIKKNEKEIVRYLSIPYTLASNLSTEYC